MPKEVTRYTNLYKARLPKVLLGHLWFVGSGGSEFEEIIDKCGIKNTLRKVLDFNLKTEKYIIFQRVSDSYSHAKLCSLITKCNDHKPSLASIFQGVAILNWISQQPLTQDRLDNSE